MKQDIDLAPVVRAMKRYQQKTTVANAAKQDFHELVREVHAAGASFRKIGAAVGLSYARIQQIVYRRDH